MSDDRCVRVEECNLVLVAQIEGLSGIRRQGIVGFESVKALAGIWPRVLSCGAGHNRLVGRGGAIETNVPQCAVPSRIISIVTGSPTDASRQIVRAAQVCSANFQPIGRRRRLS
jgi:hypothetical protein